MTVSVLRLSDNETFLDFLSPTTGILLQEWRPAIARFKGGGVFQDSSLAPGRRLVQAEFENATETFILTLSDIDQDRTIEELQKLLELLQKAIYYWESESGQPVYLEAQSPCETNPRYAIVHFYNIPGIDNPYAQPFFVAQELATLDEIELSIERGHWLANRPGTGECAEISNAWSWAYNNDYDLVASDDASGFLLSIYQSPATDTVFIGKTTSGEIIRSTNDGASFGAEITIGGADVSAFLRHSGGNLLAGVANGGIYKSTNDGVSWSNVSAAGGRNFLETADGAVYSADIGTGILYRSSNGGNSFSQVASGFYGEIMGIGQASNGTLYLVDRNTIRSSVDGSNWTIVQKIGRNFSSSSNAILRDSEGNLFALTDNVFYKLSTDGRWQPVYTINKSIAIGLTTRRMNFVSFHIGPTDTLHLLYQLVTDGGTTADITVLTSSDGGESWSVDRVERNNLELPTAIYQLESGTVMLVALNEALRNSGNSTTTVGIAPDCEGELYIINRFFPGNLTHVKVYEISAPLYAPPYVDIFPITTFPEEMLPASPAVGDAIYFGADTGVYGAGPFSSLVFDLAAGIVYTSAYVMVWEYWNGVAWATLSVTDNTALQDSTNRRFRKLGVSSVHWSPPSDWATTAIDGVTAYWVRVRISSLSGTITQPTQQNRQIYTINTPYFEISEVAGDIPALARIRLVNQSDQDGRDGSGPYLWTNQIICGLRSLNRGENFVAYLNFSNKNGLGITVEKAAGATVAFTTDPQAPAGERITFNPTGVTSIFTVATIFLHPSVARDFYGTFHLYLRARRTAGSASDFQIRLQVVTGSGGIIHTTETLQLATTTAFELLDFGQVTLPVSGAIKPEELSDIIEFRVQASAASGTPDLYLYDLILMPVDQWSIAAVDFTNSTESIIGLPDVSSITDLRRLLDIDSIGYPITDIRSLVREDDEADEVIVCAYDPIANGEAILENTTEGQRVWVLSAQTSATGTDPTWIAPPDIAYSVRLEKNERWLALRGAE